MGAALLAWQVLDTRRPVLDVLVERKPWLRSRREEFESAFADPPQIESGDVSDSP